VNRKVFTIFSLVACFLAAGSASLWGQDAAASPGVPGYLNPRTGIFHSIGRPVPQDSEPLATTTYTGTIVVNFTITVSSAIPATDQIGCVAGASVFDTAALNGLVDIAGTAVTRGTGTTVTCSVTLPYSWKLASGSTDSVILGYSITSPVDFSTPAGEWPHRAGSRSIGSIKVPVSGTTTTETVKARI